MRMVLCLLTASYNVTVADTDAVFLGDASPWLSSFDLVASRAASADTYSTAWRPTSHAPPTQVAGQLPRVERQALGRLPVPGPGAL